MQLSYATMTLRRQLIDPREGDWPSEMVWSAVKQQLADLGAADSLIEVPAGLPPLDQADPSNFLIGASAEVVLTCRVDHYPYRKTVDGRPAWAQINRLMISGWREAHDVDER